MRAVPAVVSAAISFALAAPGVSAPPTAPSAPLPGDGMMGEYLRAVSEAIHTQPVLDLKSPDEWPHARRTLQREYLYMLGLRPLPERTPLHATVTRSLPQKGYIVDMVHFQSRPRLYVTGNLYRPADVKPGDRLPAVLYVCGHAQGGRNGNKAPYQSHGIWFARHGYICLTIDTIQRGEIQASHRGTYSEQRWWWHSRGYTPAGVECWNGVRAIDYLLSRPDVDHERIGVTGISGGGATTFWIAAADERVKAAATVSGMSDLPCYVSGETVNLHCDCMFLYNAFQWPWARIAALVAPRPLLFVNSDADRLFPMDGNERIANALERVYSIFGAGDRVDSFVSIGDHAYRKDIRRGIYRFFNISLRSDTRLVNDSEKDLVVEEDGKTTYPIPPEQLRVFPEDSDIPADALNKTVDEWFVPMANVAPPAAGEFERWKAYLLAELRRLSFHCFPERIPPAHVIGETDGRLRMTSEPGIEFRLWTASAAASATPRRIFLIINSAEQPARGNRLAQLAASDDLVYHCDVRGVGDTTWTRRNPPNYVERAHALLGRTVDTGRVWDVIAAARYLHEEGAPRLPVCVAGSGPGAILAAYAALFEPDIDSVVAVEPPMTHMDPAAPQFLNVLRVCDIPEVLGMLAPRSLVIPGLPEKAASAVRAAYAATGHADRLTLHMEP